MRQIFGKLILLLCILYSQSLSAQYHNYCNFDLAAVPPGVTSVIDVSANDDYNPPTWVVNYYAISFTCDYPYRYGNFSSEQGATWSILNQDSVAYTPPVGFMNAWDHFIYGVCRPSAPTYSHDSASVYVYVTNVVTTNDPQYLSGVSIYPNPVNETLRLDGPNHLLIETVSVWSMDGRQVLAPQPWRESLAVSSLPNGIYLLEIKMEGQPFYLRFHKS